MAPVVVEKGIDEIQVSADHQRQGTEGAEHQPEGGDDQEAFAPAQFVFGIAKNKPEQRAAAEGEHQRIDKIHGLAVTGIQRDQQRRDQAETVQNQKDPQDA